MNLFDSHCHLNDPVFDDDLEAVYARAAAAGVAACLVVGSDPTSSRRAVELAAERPGTWAAVGVHPHDARNCSRAHLAALTRLARRPRVVAWGEIGLDFNRMFSPVADQEKWLERQLEQALELDLPVVLHERDSRGRLVEMLSAAVNTGLRGVVHCFSGSAPEMHRYLDMGLHIGVTGIITHAQRGADLRAMLPQLPLERLLIETDAPYLTPSPERNRHRRNEPAFVARVLARTADVLDLPPERLAPTVWRNTCRLFGIPSDGPPAID